MTIDDLYVALVALQEASELGFEDARKRLGKRFDEIRTRLDSIDARLGRVETSVLRLGTRVEEIETR